MTVTEEMRARLALGWAIRNSCIRFPVPLRDPGAWVWDPHYLRLTAQNASDFDFHLAAQRRGKRLERIAILTITDGSGNVRWESVLPPDIETRMEEADG